MRNRVLWFSEKASKEAESAEIAVAAGRSLAKVVYEQLSGKWLVQFVNC